MKLHTKSKANIPIHRNINSISVLVEYLTEQGFELDAILEKGGLSSQDLKDPSMRISPIQELQILGEVYQVSNRPDIGLILGEQYHIGIHGSLGFGAMLCNSFSDAIKFLYDYMELSLTFYHHKLYTKDNLSILQVTELIELDNLKPFIFEREFVSALRMCSDIIGGPLPLEEVNVAYPEPEYADQYEKYFNCPVKFSTEEHSLIFDKQLLKYPLPKANPLMKKACEQDCIQLIHSLKSHETISDKIFMEIRYQKEECLPSIETFAKRLNMSSRTLRRRLSSEGTSYQAILDESLKSKALALLKSSTLTIEEIAAEVGYSDTANFYHAFKRWTGTTPKKFQ